MPSMPSTMISLLPAAFGRSHPPAENKYRSENAAPCDVAALPQIPIHSASDFPSTHCGTRRRTDQCGRGQIFNAGILAADRAIRKQNAGNKNRIDAMVAAPGLGIVFQNVFRDLAHRAVPRHAISLVVPHQHVGGWRRIGPPVEVRVAYTVRIGASPFSSRSAVSLSMISLRRAFRFLARATIPCASRPFMFMYMPPRPSA